MKEILARLQNRESRSDLMLTKLVEKGTFEKVQFVSLFMSFPEEIDTKPIAEYCWSKSIVVCVPEFVRHQPGQPIVFREWVRDAELDEIHQGLFHPKYGPLHRFEEMDLIFVPGMAFTLDGKRLGRGKGFYDQLLGQAPANSIGLCFAEQILEDLPFEAHDQRVSNVLSI